jgi:hypothetical protein
MSFNYKIINFPTHIYVRYDIIRNNKLQFKVKFNQKRFAKRFKVFFIKLNCLYSLIKWLYR